MPTIAPNLLRSLFRQVYFVNGTAYAGKSTLVRTLAEKYHGVMCGENYHDELTHLTDVEHQPALRYFDTMSGWQEFLSRTPEEYCTWIEGVNREAAELELLLLIRLAQLGRPVFVDTNIPLDMLHEIGANVLIMLSPQSMSVERFFDRDDPEKQFLLQQLESFPDPEAAKANFRACLAALNSPECYAAFERSGFPVYVRREDSTPEEAVSFAEEVFGLRRAEPENPAEPAWRAEKRRLVERYREANRTAEKGGIVFTGSSLMEMFPVERWARELPGCPPVYNRGVGGYRTEDMLPILDALVTDLMPRRVFINIGTNDLSDAAVTIEALMARYEQILHVIRERVPGVEIVLMAYYPINADAATDEGMRACLRIRTNERIAEANRAVSALAERHGLLFRDFNAPLTDAQGRLKAEYTIEGMHIREEGYRAIWPAVAEDILR